MTDCKQALTNHEPLTEWPLPNTDTQHSITTTCLKMVRTQHLFGREFEQSFKCNVMIIFKQ